MYLKEIRSYGFKSFADKTVIELGKNINGIVGPNGSGKSNVVDAVRWVLGEQSNKSLRADNALDVIFSGSKSRKPLNSASVTLVFDNTDHYLPLDFSEVAIKRVLYKTGESEYYINNEKCRLKDITDILIDSGIARESFNIISQGKIDEILSTKATDRRVIFEEAAGVLKYKKRKEEALRKLEKTNDNLTRVNDIILELEDNIEPLKEQSLKAKAYLDFKQELKDIEIALITSDIEKLNIDYQNSKKQIDEINDNLIDMAKNSSSYDIAILEEKDKLKNILDKLQINQNKLIELTSKQEKINADIRVYQTRVKYAKDRNDNKNNILTLKEEALKLKQMITTINNEIEVLNKHLEDISLKIQDNTNKYNELVVKKNKIETNLNNNNLKKNNLQSKKDYLENSIINNDTMPSSIKNILNNPKFEGVHNTIANLIEVENEYKLAISTSLLASASYLVVDTPNVAKVLVKYLKDNNLGRATFYPISSIKERYIDKDTLSKIEKMPGFINIASNLVSCDKTYENIILNQLGSVIVANDIDNATIISDATLKKYKVVTLDGQVINIGGSITGGSKIKINNVILQKYELEEVDSNIDLISKDNLKLQLQSNDIIKQINEINNNLNNLNIEKNSYLDNIKNKKINYDEINDTYETKIKEISNLENINKDDKISEEEKLTNLLYEIKDEINNLIKENEILKIDKDKITDSINELENTSKNSNSYIAKQEKNLKEHEIKVNRIDVKLDNLLLELNENYNMTFDYAKANYHLEIETEEARGIVSRLKDKINKIGIVNLGSIEEYERVNTRYEFLTKQKEDLLKAEDTLLEIIDEMDEVMKDKFLDTFNQIKEEFKIVFRDLFKGGDAELILTDPDNILETGIEIKAEPPGKKLQSISLLSGGEKTFTAISLLFAILNVRPVAFCLLDEVEAALDEANVEAFGNYLYKYKDKTQFVLITHKKKTMEFADILYGITMQESGVSKLVSVKLEDINN